MPRGEGGLCTTAQHSIGYHVRCSAADAAPGHDVLEAGTCTSPETHRVFDVLVGHPRAVGGVACQQRLVRRQEVLRKQLTPVTQPCCSRSSLHDRQCLAPPAAATGSPQRVSRLTHVLRCLSGQITREGAHLCKRISQVGPQHAVRDGPPGLLRLHRRQRAADGPVALLDDRLSAGMYNLESHAFCSMPPKNEGLSKHTMWRWGALAEPTGFYDLCCAYQQPHAPCRAGRCHWRRRT